MTDPERLSKSPNRSLAGLLLRAAAEEKPATAVLNRASAAVSALSSASAKSAASLAPAVGVKHAASSVSKLAAGTSLKAAGTSALTGTTLGIGAVAQWIAIGALGGALAMSSLQALTAEPGTKPTRAIPVAATNASLLNPSQRSLAVAPTTPEPVASSAAKEPERPIVVEAQKSRGREPAPGELAKPEAPARTDSGLLAAEVRFVDQGRAALQHAAFSQAIEQLAPYESLFPRQQLLTEVLFMRMEAFSRLGDVERARALAARVLALGVVGGQAAQAREVLGP